MDKSNNLDVIESISADDLSKIIDKVNLIDVRKSGERSNGYLLNSKHISLDDFQEKINEIDKVKATIFIVQEVIEV